MNGSIGNSKLSWKAKPTSAYESRRSREASWRCLEEILPSSSRALRFHRGLPPQEYQIDSDEYVSIKNSEKFPHDRLGIERGEEVPGRRSRVFPWRDWDDVFVHGPVYRLSGHRRKGVLPELYGRCRSNVGGIFPPK